MARCILHIGMHKTGSTSIQRSLSGFADSQFLYYEDQKGANQTRAMFGMLGTGTAGAGRRESENAAAPDVLRRLDAAIPTLGQRQMLISAEGLWLLATSRLEDLSRILAGRFDSVGVVAYVRSPGAFISSFFQQRVKGGSRRTGHLDIEREYPNYRRSLGKFDDVFGRDNVQLWKFDPARFPGGCVVRDFIGKLGINLPVQSIVRINESLSRSAVGLLYTYWKLGEDLGSWPISRMEKQELVRKLMQIESTRFRFSPDIIKPVLERNRADVEWMEARLGQPLEEDLGEARPGDVRGEADLLAPDPAGVSALLAMLGDETPPGVEGKTPAEVASLVHALRRKKGSLAAEKAPGGITALEPPRPHDARRPVKIEELIAEVRRANPGRFDGIDGATAAELVRQVFRHVNAALANSTNRAVSYDELGRFRVKRTTKARKSGTIERPRIIFRAASPGHAKGS